MTDFIQVKAGIGGQSAQGGVPTLWHVTYRSVTGQARFSPPAPLLGPSPSKRRVRLGLDRRSGVRAPGRTSRRALRTPTGPGLDGFDSTLARSRAGETGSCGACGV